MITQDRTIHEEEDSARKALKNAIDLQDLSQICELLYEFPELLICTLNTRPPMSAFTYANTQNRHQAAFELLIHLLTTNVPVSRIYQEELITNVHFQAEQQFAQHLTTNLCRLFSGLIESKRFTALKRQQSIVQATASHTLRLLAFRCIDYCNTLQQVHILRHLEVSSFFSKDWKNGFANYLVEREFQLNDEQHESLPKASVISYLLKRRLLTPYIRLTTLYTLQQPNLRLHSQTETTPQPRLSAAQFQKLGVLDSELQEAVKQQIRQKISRMVNRVHPSWVSPQSTKNNGVTLIIQRLNANLAEVFQLVLDSSSPIQLIHIAEAIDETLLAATSSPNLPVFESIQRYQRTLQLYSTLLKSSTAEKLQSWALFQLPDVNSTLASLSDFNYAFSGAEIEKLLETHHHIDGSKCAPRMRI
jgi:hypothetical protein